MNITKKELTENNCFYTYLEKICKHDNLRCVMIVSVRCNKLVASNYTLAYVKELEK